MRTIIAGSRDNVTFKQVSDAMQAAPFKITTVISGTARGADRYGEEIARIYGIPVERYPADWDRYGKSAGYKRNEQMAEVAQALVAVWDGQSKGTKHMIDIAKKHELTIYVHFINSHILNKETI